MSQRAASVPGVARRVTLQDVARRAKVSRTTASNVLLGTGRLSEATRQRVRQAMADLGYVYHQSAGSLRRRTARTIGMVVTNIDRPHFGELLLGLESTVSDSGYTLLVLTTRDRLDRQTQAISTLREHQVAAAAIIPATSSDAAFLETLRSWGVPTVFMTRYVRGHEWPYVGPDDVLGGRMAVEHLLDHGCGSIAYLGGYREVNSRIDRVEGARQAIERRGGGTTLRDLTSPPTGEGGLELGRRLLTRGEPLPDGVLCHSDAVAMGFERALHEAGRAPDVRVVGYDGVAATRYFVPAITSVATNGLELGERAAGALLRAAEDGVSVRSHRQIPELVVRESCGTHDGS